MAYLRYAADIETPKPDEAEAIAGIVRAMTRQSEKVAGREQHAVRASHAKSTALVVGEMRVHADLPPELAQGMFATPGTHPVAIRFAQGPGETLGDRVGTHRGMAIKVFDVEGPKIDNHSENTQDFVLASGTTFPSGTAQGFLKDEKQLETGTSLPEGVKSAVSSAARNVNRVLHALGTESAKADFFGHPYLHPLGEPYYSQAPLRFGDYVAKLAAFPVFPELDELKGMSIDVDGDPDAFRHVATDFIREHETVFELRAQLWTDAESQPIEDASVEWSETESPFRTVATIRIAPQDAYSPERQRYFDEVMSFRPAHALQAHQPLGSVMRARLKVYQALSAFRHDANAVSAEEPENVERIPA